MTSIHLKKSAVIFDCDGVLFDSRKANIHFYNDLLAHFRMPPMTKDEESFVHMHTGKESIRHIFRNTSFVERALEYYLQMDYTPFIRDMVMVPGLKTLLGQLKYHVGLAIATNRSNTIGKVLKWHGLDHYFEIVVSSLDVTHPKPHPESLFKIFDFFSVGPLDAFYVGDSEVDEKTALAAGVTFISFKNRTLHADFHVENIKEVADIVGIGRS